MSNIIERKDIIKHLKELRELEYNKHQLESQKHHNVSEISLSDLKISHLNSEIDSINSERKRLIKPRSVGLSAFLAFLRAIPPSLFLAIPFGFILSIIYDLSGGAFLLLVLLAITTICIIPCFVDAIKANKKMKKYSSQKGNCDTNINNLNIQIQDVKNKQQELAQKNLDLDSRIFDFDDQLKTKYKFNLVPRQFRYYEAIDFLYSFMITSNESFKTALVICQGHEKQRSAQELAKLQEENRRTNIMWTHMQLQNEARQQAAKEQQALFESWKATDRYLERKYQINTLIQQNNELIQKVDDLSND